MNRSLLHRLTVVALLAFTLVLGLPRPAAAFLEFLDGAAGTGASDASTAGRRAVRAGRIIGTGQGIAYMGAPTVNPRGCSESVECAHWRSTCTRNVLTRSNVASTSSIVDVKLLAGRDQTRLLVLDTEAGWDGQLSVAVEFFTADCRAVGVPWLSPSYYPSYKVDHAHAAHFQLPATVSWMTITGIGGLNMTWTLY